MAGSARLELEPGGLLAHGRRPSAPGQDTARYVTNPAAGFSLAFNKYGTVAATPYLPTDQREGPHGLTFRTPVLARPLDIVGPIALHLVAASTASDTDWYAKLSDVAPDGSESIVTEGSLRASHRALDPAKSTPTRPYHPHVDPRPIEPNRFYGYDIEIWPTAYRLAPGHRLQLRLTSSDLPTHMPGSVAFDRDRPQDARIDLLAPATNSVRFDGSCLMLPGACRANFEEDPRKRRAVAEPRRAGRRRDRGRGEGDGGRQDIRGDGGGGGAVATAEGGSLPFTGLAVGGLLIAGVMLIVTGRRLRRRVDLPRGQSG
jgi:hypothetical protein